MATDDAHADTGRRDPRERPDDAVRRVLGYARRVAVVGLSDKPWRASHGVAADLQARGYEVVPVNPYVEEVLGERAWPSLADVPVEVDVVDVFRREEHLVDVTRAAIEVGARAVWYQLGLRSREGRRLAEEAGLDVVEDRCLKVEVARHAAQLELPPPR